MPIQSFDRETLKAVKERAEALLKPLEAQYGLTLTYKGGAFTASTFDVRFEFAIKSADGKPTGRDAEAFAVYHSRHQLPVDLLGKPFEYQGKFHKIVGYRPKSTTAPFLVERDGKLYKFTAIALASALQHARLITKEKLVELVQRAA
jgi:hypothetical protein